MCSAVVSMSCWVLNSGTLLGTGNVDIGVHFRTFSVCAVCLEIVGIPPFWHEKGLPDFSENPQGGVRGIRTLEPLKTTNTLAGCPYRPLRHDSTVLPFQRKYVLWDCAAMLVSGLPTRRCVKVRHYIRTFVSISCEKRLSWNHEHRTENRSSQT